MFDSTELSKMRDTQELYMQDTGRRLVYSRTINDFGEPIASYTASTATTACGLEMKSGEETDKSTMTLVKYDAILRLPITTIIDPKDHWRIEKRYGENITAQEYEIVSPIQRGPSGIRVLLKRVEV